MLRIEVQPYRKTDYKPVIYSTKSFSMVFSKSITTPTCNIDVHGNVLEQVVVHKFSKFVFLRCKMCKRLEGEFV